MSPDYIRKTCRFQPKIEMIIKTNEDYIGHIIVLITSINVPLVVVLDAVVPKNKLIQILTWHTV